MLFVKIKHQNIMINESKSDYDLPIFCKLIT